MRTIAILLICNGVAGAQDKATKIGAVGPCALDALVAAYDTSPQPERLYDIAQCQRQLGHHEEAIFFFNGYLERGHDVDRNAVTALIADEQRALAGEPGKNTSPLVVTTPATASRRPIYKRWWLWTTVAVVALGGAAAAIAVSLPSQSRLPSGALGTIDAR